MQQQVATGQLQLEAARAHLLATHQRGGAGQIQDQAEQANALCDLWGFQGRNLAHVL
jgi:hypothetical protein